MLCSLQASCCIPTLLRLPHPCAWGYRRVGLGIQDAVSGIQESGSGVSKGTGRYSAAPMAFHLVPIGPRGMVVGAGYYVTKQLFPQMLQPGAVSGICCCIPMVGAPWLGSSSDSCVSIRAVGSAPYGVCAMLTAGPGQRVVEPAGSFGAGASAEAPDGHGVSKIPEHPCGPSEEEGPGGCWEGHGPAPSSWEVARWGI